MSNFEAWIGDCHLRQVDDGEYRCQVAVWAQDSNSFRTTLLAEIERFGYSIFWLEEVLPASQYLSRHSGQHRQIGALAKAVHPGHTVELGPMQCMVTEDNREPARYLFIEEIEGVEPLDLQFGVYPRKTVPDVLIEPIFGQSVPGVAEIAHYGSADAVPSMKTYAIVNADRFQWRSSEIEFCGLPHRCLFQGKAAQERKDEAPYLIELSQEVDFTRRLFTHDITMLPDMESAHLWQLEACMLVRSRASLDEVWHHFRRFTRFQGDNGKWFHFRFWEPSIFTAYWKHFATSYARVARFYCSRDFTQIYKIYFIHAGILTHFMPKVEDLKISQEKVSSFALTAEDHAFFQSLIDERFKNRVKARLLKKMENAPDDKKQQIPRTVEMVFKYIQERNGGSLIDADDCFTLSFLAILWGNATDAILKGQLMNDPLLLISLRIAFAKSSYFETLNNIPKGKI
ncbi:DUF4123 domain-containing protein [Thalassospira sp.]|uniref:DUF4123 domain-containing protein n=1 Tax=Thalassospira sp. TaxID=1912094 RepID=UPI003AA8C482